MPRGISEQTRKRLWLRSGGRCAFPACETQLVAPIDDRSDTVVGIECHIVAQRDDPARVARAESSLTDEERDLWRHLIDDRHDFPNLVVMCPTHSTIIDDPSAGYSVAQVVEMKREHERAEDERRSGPPSADEEAQLRYAEIIDEWEDRVDLNGWGGWMGGVFSDGHPRMAIEDFERLTDTRAWLFSRVWPGTEPELERAFENFGRVAQDLQLVLEQYPHEVLRNGGWIAPTRFYNDPDWIRRIDDHNILGEMYSWYSYLIEDLALELARAANLVCAAVRKFVDPRYRLEEGLVVIESGPYEDFMFRRHHPQYGDSGWSPYQGLRAFVEDRVDRDEHRGEGPPPEHLRLPGDSYFGA